PSLPLVNQGTVIADPGARLTVTGSNVENSGTLEALEGGVLVPENLQNDGLIVLTNGILNLTGTFTRAAVGALAGTGTVNIIGTLDNTNRTLTLDTNITWQLVGGT